MDPKIHNLVPREMCMKSIVLTIGKIAIVVGAVVLVWKLNGALGYRRGEIDKGLWYVMKSSNGGSTWIEKGIDPENPFLDSDRAQEMMEQMPEYVESLQGYGAIYIDIGWLGDSELNSSGWHLFQSEIEALEFLRSNGVEKRRISRLYR